MGEEGWRGMEERRDGEGWHEYMSMCAENTKM